MKPEVGLFQAIKELKFILIYEQGEYITPLGCVIDTHIFIIFIHFPVLIFLCMFIPRDKGRERNLRLNLTIVQAVWFNGKERLSRFIIDCHLMVSWLDSRK